MTINFTTTWDLRSAWASLPNQLRLFLFGLSVMAILSTVSLLRMFFKQLSISNGEMALKAETRVDLHRRLENLRQLHTLFLLLFGLFLTEEIFLTARSCYLSHMSLEAQSTIELVVPAVFFSTVSLITFTLLHSLQWFVFSQVQRKRHQARI
jgi:hypothetical protein